MAHTLRQFTPYRNKIQDIGECQTKDRRLLVANLLDGDVGNKALPRKSIRAIHRKRTFIAGCLVVICLGVAVAAEWRHIQPNNLRSTRYSLIVRGSDGLDRPISKEMVFPPGYRVKLKFSTVQDGFLYLLNEGPATNATQVWTWLFPQPDFQSGSAAIRASSSIIVPPGNGQYFIMDKLLGKEKVYLIWSDRAVPELEQVKSSVFLVLGKSGGLLLPAEAAIAHHVVQANSSQVDLAEKDGETMISGKGPIIVKMIILEHM